MNVLIVDDDDKILFALSLLLRSEGIDCVACRSPQDALHAVRDGSFELALVDLNYVEDTTSGKEGLGLIAMMRQIDEDLPIVAMTGWGSIDIAVEAMKRGAVDFVEKPWRDNHRLLNLLRIHVRLGVSQKREKKLSAENSLLRERAGDKMVCVSPAMSQVLAMARRIAASSLPILITGENGTGKSLLADYIHRHSSRAQGPFISVNMGAISEGAFESEMFGHVKGAYTDAKTARIGRIELAEQGTLFMDEIANLPLTQQAKILRLLEEGDYELLGSSRTRKADIRVVSATNGALDTLVLERSFRQDLLYRLNGITLRIPALRERLEDIAPLATRFLDKARQHYASPVSGFSARAMKALEDYPWPGNVRELQHVVERSMLLAHGGEIQEDDLQLAVASPALCADRNPIPPPAGMTLDEADLWFVQQALARHQGNANEAAKALGISRSALYRRLGKRVPP